MIVTDIKWLRDPYVVVKDGVYYMYGTEWRCYKNTSGRLDGAWEKIDLTMTFAHPEWVGHDHWAPEVHEYNGAYYMFTTYRNMANDGRHGCTILRADSPEGPFVEVTDGTVTPAEYACIDGTLYVDPDGQPWMVFVSEWEGKEDLVGTFEAAKLSDDLSHFISDPIELFRADEPVWKAPVRGGYVTDGCWMYTTAEGDLLMLWASFDAHGYVETISRSSNGRLDGEWIHEEKPLYSKAMTGTYDGGHGMVFTDLGGQMYLSFHSPNHFTAGRGEKPVFLAVREENGTLVWDEPCPCEAHTQE